MATLQANKGVVRRFYDDWNRGAIDFEALVADEIVNYQPETEPVRGRENFAAAIRGVMNAVPDSRWDVVDEIAEDDRVVVRITWSGTYNAPQHPCPDLDMTAQRHRNTFCVSLPA